eukprot:TRINITY_DN7998_c1_g1_i1.p1 TRINITY_DN7998_c1_g1~~TRINITY_DN7998_c1_g1_i1.p1  ORF type:complete len:456 (+),score=212.78 TRINITY_DN7998_c1_g1_i1:31-1398(+)
MSRFLSNRILTASRIALASKTQIRPIANTSVKADTKPYSSLELMKMEHKYGAHNYHPLPVVFSKAQGAEVWDVEGKRYIDFLSAYSAVNQGHCHPKIIKAMVDQASKLTLSSRAFYNETFPRFTKYITEYFGYESVMPMNSGAEGVETAIKLARKWAYTHKKVPENEAIVICASGCFHGRTLTAISMSDDPSSYEGFGPHLPGLRRIPYNDLAALEEVLNAEGDKVCAFIVEPIQGEAGVIVPDDGYLLKSAELLKKHNALLIADEIQTGLCRSGKLLACDYDGVKPDVVILGKALSGGCFPVSCVLTSKEVMLSIKPGEHGSTFGGSSLAASVAIASLEVLNDEKLADNSFAQGEKFRSAISALKSPFVKEIRGRGLLNAIEIVPDFKFSAWQICLLLAQRGILCKPTHDYTIRMSPPLVLTSEQTQEAIDIITKLFKELPTMDVSQVPQEPKF